MEHKQTYKLPQSPAKMAQNAPRSPQFSSSILLAASNNLTQCEQLLVAITLL